MLEGKQREMQFSSRTKVLNLCIHGCRFDLFGTFDTLTCSMCYNLLLSIVLFYSWEDTYFTYTYRVTHGNLTSFEWVVELVRNLMAHGDAREGK